MSIRLLSALLLTIASLTASAKELDAYEPVRSAVRKVDPTLQIEALSDSPVRGLYRATLGGAEGYLSEDGRYFVAGDMFEVATRRNLAEEARQGVRLSALAELSADDPIVFSPAKAAHTITVFTDVDCGYCRKLHTEVEQYEARGVAIRYVAYPRSGPGSESWKTMESVWCAKDRRDALTRAKRGEKIEALSNCSAPQIAKGYALGQRLGIEGTPTIVLDDGRSLGGYLPVAQIVGMLEGMPTGAVRAAR